MKTNSEHRFRSASSYGKREWRYPREDPERNCAIRNYCTGAFDNRIKSDAHIHLYVHAKYANALCTCAAMHLTRTQPNAHTHSESETRVKRRGQYYKIILWCVTPAVVNRSVTERLFARLIDESWPTGNLIMKTWTKAEKECLVDISTRSRNVIPDGSKEINTF